MVKVRAVIEWLTRDQGGRHRLPGGGPSPYYSLVRFTDTDSPWPPPAGWSLVVQQDEASSGPLRWLADIHYLVAEAPHDSLRPGRPFELYEGSRCVARGEILPAYDGVIPPLSSANSLTRHPEIEAVPSRG